MFFLPYSPEDVMQETESLLETQRREKKSSSWVFTELIGWEDRNKGRVLPAYGKYYHIASQARRVADQEISLEEMQDDLQEIFGKYWSPLPVISRFMAAIGKILAVAMLFLLVGAAHYGLSLLVGNALAASIVIGVLAAAVLVPQGVRGLWEWYKKRVDAMYAVYRRSIAQRLQMLFSSRCPRCGRDLGNLPADKDGVIQCECGFRIDRKSEIRGNV
jgi:DNA-directed RNA polymerase subunit RPC12/RpoP